MKIKLLRPRDYKMLTTEEAFEYKKEGILLHDEARKASQY